MRRMTVILIAMVLVTICATVGVSAADSQAKVYFEMEDPSGDDYGPGTYLYPKNESFSPYSGLFDLTRFKVWSDLEQNDEVIFDLTFGAMSNPWAAPEGFIHQVINIYIDTVPGGGRLETFKPGALVRFPQDQGWEIFLRGVGWQGSACYYLDTVGTVSGIPVYAALLGDGHTVRLRVSRQLIGEPQKTWGYYVLIGSYDGFGPDNFRTVGSSVGEWHFGGGTDQSLNPNVIDMLAQRGGQMRQEKQLSGYSVEEGTFTVIYPVREGSGSFFPVIGWIAGLLIVAAGLGILVGRFGLIHRFPVIFKWKVLPNSVRKNA